MRIRTGWMLVAAVAAAAELFDAPRDQRTADYVAGRYG